MKRLFIGAGTMLVMAITLACGNDQQPGTNAEAPDAAVATPEPELAPERGERRLTIVMSENRGEWDDVTAACIGSVTGYIPKVQRKQVVRWTVVNDPDDQQACPNLNASMVELRFDDAIWVDDREFRASVPPPLMYPPVAVLPVNRGMNLILGRVHHTINDTDPQVPNGRYKYFVWYRGEKASPDPELDIDGYCGSNCGPGGS